MDTISNIVKSSITHFNRSALITSFIIIFIFSSIWNIPDWLLANVVKHYSKNLLSLSDQNGNFWHGSGLLIAHDSHNRLSSPLVLLNWKVSLGISKFIDVKFTIGNDPVADVYLNSSGLNLDNLNLSLSLMQISKVVEVLQDLGLTGNLRLSAKHVVLGKKNSGQFEASINNVSSGISPVNPLGSYDITFNPKNNSIDVSSSSNSTLKISGSGDTSRLSLIATIDPTKRDKLIQLLTALGNPNADGSYNFKVF